MARMNLTNEEIEEILFEEITDIEGNAKLNGKDLYIRTSEASSWLYIGSVVSESGAQATIDGFFEGINQ